MSTTQVIMARTPNDVALCHLSLMDRNLAKAKPFLEDGKNGGIKISFWGYAGRGKYQLVTTTEQISIRGYHSHRDRYG